MVTVRMPSMVAGRQMAASLVEAIVDDVHGRDVLLDCRHLVSASPSFVAELLHRLLDLRGAARVVVRRPSAQFVRYLDRAAADLGVEQRVTLEQPRAVSA